MKALTISGVVFTTAVLLGGAGCAASAHPDPYDSPYDTGYDSPRFVVDINYFYDSLTPYGLWVNMDPYGPCWVPDVPYGWRPYSTDGYWVRSDYGWTWVSDYQWGWAPFHYGRWAWSDDFGWVWVPGYDWAPAWVSWRYGDGFVGWAPLPPEAQWRVGVGFTIGDFDTVIRPHAWCFVRDRDFVRPHVGRYVMRDRDDDRYIRITRNVTRYRYDNGRIFNDGVDVRSIEERTGRRLPVYRVTDDRINPRRAVIRGRDIQVYRPEVRSDGRSDDRQVRAPEYVQRQADENRQALRRQREERAQIEKQYRDRMQNLPPAEQRNVERRMTNDIRKLDDRQRIERRQIVERNAKARENPKADENRGRGRDRGGPRERGSSGDDKR